MFPDQHSELRPLDVRPRRTTRPPVWMEDYEVPPPRGPQQPYYRRGRSPERHVRMTPLTQPSLENDYTSEHGAAAPYQSDYMESDYLIQGGPASPQRMLPGQTSPEVMEALYRVMEDNQRLRLQMRDMHRRLDTHVPVRDLPPPPLQHNLRSPPLYGSPEQHSRPQQPLWEEEHWPPPPPSVAEDDIYPPVRPPQDSEAELEELLRNMTPIHREQPSGQPHPHYSGPRVQTPEYCAPYTPPRTVSLHSKPPLFPRHETSYRGPQPTIPFFTKGDPREFARLKIALENLLPVDATERFKYQILVDHLKYEEALLVADSYTNSTQPYTDTMISLIEHYGQPHQLALRKIAELMDAPNISRGDTRGFKLFALKLRSLVGMLDQLGDEGQTELHCGSHVTRLLCKLPQDMRAEFKRFLYPMRVVIPSLLDFADWLNYELKIQETVYETLPSETKSRTGTKDEHRRDNKTRRSTNILQTTDHPENMTTGGKQLSSTNLPEKPAYCPYCNNTYHFLDHCSNFAQLTVEQITAWIKTNKRCWRCGRSHQAAQCRLKVTCQKCKGKHLQALHEVNKKPATADTSCLVNTTNEVLYLDRRSGCSQVVLKVSKVLLRNGRHTMETFAILDDGSERTIILPAAVQRLKLTGEPEDLLLRTVRQDLRMLHGAAVTFSISPADQPQKSFKIHGAFSAAQLGLAEHTYPVQALQRKYRHLKGLPLQSFSKVQPLLLIGSDYPHLISPVEPVRLGPPGGPAAVKTRLGWVLQGPTKHIKLQSSQSQCLHVSTSSPSAALLQNVERLWQLDVLPYQSKKLITRSRQDQEAIHLLETKTTRIDVDGIQRYATPLLRVKNMAQLCASKKAVLPNLRSTEKRLLRDPQRAEAYCAEMAKLKRAGYAVEVPEEEVDTSAESWFIPHHMVSHNGKNRIVFNCSFTYNGDNLNQLLLPGPTLSSSLIGVLLRFREHSIAVSSDIKGMFHQVLLLPEDRCLLRFLWRDLKTEEPPSIYTWWVLPFGTTCSPCCATFALRKHVFDHSQPGEDVRESIERSFYVDNCLQSFSSVQEAQHLVNKLTSLLAKGGFELRQWASNIPGVISHLPREARSESRELLISEKCAEPQELALGLRWLCSSDTLKYKYQVQDKLIPTMRNIYRTLARLYDPLGFIVPFTTRAKVLVQQLWIKEREWDDPSLPEDVLQSWQSWEEELQHLSQISLPRCYVSPELDSLGPYLDLHIFADASERAYGSVGYLRAESEDGRVEVAFLAARSRVAPKKQQTMPRLELCAALTAAQLASLLQSELTVTLRDVVLWTDSTTVLTWIRSDSCRYKVFVGTRIAELQELTDVRAWRYVDSGNNPADDITRGKKLLELSSNSRWRQGPAFLQQRAELWPLQPVINEAEAPAELRKPISCFVATTQTVPLPDNNQFSSFKALIEAVARSCHGAAGPRAVLSAEEIQEAERKILRQAQQDSFTEDYNLLSSGKPICTTSRLLPLAPEYDETLKLIRVGGRLRRCDQLEPATVHPVILDPHHRVTQLIIKDTDDNLHHPGAERLFAELRRTYWILRGREAVRRYQRSCLDCRRWRATPTVPKMADLPSARLRLMKPPFFSTGMDCFGPFTVKIGRRHEKRWGILFKCLTTRAVHLDVLSSLDTDSFLMSLRRFVARRGKPAELLSDQGTNFKGGERELQEAFQALHPTLQAHLAKHQIRFRYNPPSAPHFGGAWEREVRSVKTALYATIQSQPVPEEVLRTVLIEVEGILNSKPLGYVSTDVADADPVTPNMLLMGRRDPSLPQAVYGETEMLSRRRWRHSQVLADQFWKCFIRHYLPTLQTRPKWHKDSPPLKPGTIAMIVDPQLPRSHWPIGHITQVIPGQDGRVRTAVVQVNGKTYTRPVARLVALPVIPDTDTTCPS